MLPLHVQPRFGSFRLINPIQSGVMPALRSSSMPS